MSLPGYSEYKDGGVTCLGKVPTHWAVLPLKYSIARIESGVSVNAVDEPADSGEIGVLKTSCVYTGAFNPSENKAVVAEELSRVACPVHAGTIIVSRMNTPALVGAAGFVTESRDDLFLPDRLWQVHCREDANPAFIHYWTSSPTYRAQVEMACAGTSASMQNLSQDAFLNFTFPLPPPDEQTAIATFLDRETGKIDALIAEQERLLALLVEKRQATISHAVTKGLNPEAPMKDSGVAWLGEVPVHWRVSPLKYLVTFSSGGTPSKENLDYWDGDIPWASAKDLKVETLHDTADHITHLAVDNRAASLLPAGTVLVVVRGMILARIFPVTQIAVPMAINQDLKGLQPTEAVDSNYLAWLLRGSADESLQRLDEAGHGTKALRMDAWSSMQLPVPPRDEQIEIASFLDAETAKLDALKDESERAIALLKERRSALIAAAVTGQIDVRQA